MTEYLVRWEDGPRAWVLYEAANGDVLFQQIADNDVIWKDDPNSAQEWAMCFIWEHGNSKNFVLKGPSGYTATGNTRKR